MKKNIILAAVLASTLTLTSCGNTGQIAQALLGSGLGTGTQDTTAQTIATGTNLLGNLLSSFMGGVAVTEQELVGTWSYQGVDAVFESENVLAKAGGTLAAAQLESKIDTYVAKYGIQKGITKFTFNADKTFTATMGKKNFAGTYVYDPNTKVLTLTAMGGLFNLRPKVARTATGISLLFPADKLLTLLNTTATIVGNTGALGQLDSLTQLLNNYSGLQLGLQLQK